MIQLRQTDRSTSRELTAKFSEGEIISADQSGDCYQEDFTYRAKYSADEETISLSGSPHVVDASQGVTLTADSIQLNRKTRNAFAQENVKTTYAKLNAQPSGAMLASADPIHVTGSTVTFNSATGVGKYPKPGCSQGKHRRSPNHQL